MSFNGLRVLSLESRRGAEMATLIRKQGGDPFVAPSMREVSLDEHTEAFAFADGLLRGDFDCVILLTGVGTRMLWKTLTERPAREGVVRDPNVTRYDEAELKAALAKLT